MTATKKLTGPQQRVLRMLAEAKGEWLDLKGQDVNVAVGLAYGSRGALAQRAFAPINDPGSRRFRVTELGQAVAEEYES